MALSNELREAIASRHRPRICKQVQELPDGQGGERSSLNEREATSFANEEGTEQKDRSFSPEFPNPLALPPPSPDWSHLLCSRPHEPTSALFARTALLAVGCRLSISPTRAALCEPARCHSAGAVCQLLVRVFGERGLAIAYQLAGRGQPPKMVDKTNVISNGGAPPDLLAPEVLRSLPLQVARLSCTSRATRHRGVTGKPTRSARRESSARAIARGAVN
jgi:hypothetical protein